MTKITRRESLVMMTAGIGLLTLPSSTKFLRASVQATIASILLSAARDLLVGVGAGVIADSVSGWLSSLSGEKGAVANQADEVMVNAGFPYKASKVRNIDAVWTKPDCYGVHNRDESNACLAFVHRYAPSSYDFLIVEGPFILGMALAYENWNSSTSAARGIIPISGPQAAGGDFLTDTGAVEWETDAGSIEMAYSASGRQPVLSVVSRHDNGGVLFGSDFALS